MAAKGSRNHPKPPQSAAQRQRELARMLVRMDEMLKSTGEIAVRARARVSVGGLNRYRRFAKRVRDFFALAGVAEEKLYYMPELADSPMATALDRMHARMVVLFVEGSWSFFDLYRRVPEMPLGAHEICGVELRGLYEIRKFLDDERYDGERGLALRRQAERVTDLMHEIMERVPPLEDFGDLPSISPKGVSRQPIKTQPKRQAPPPPPVAEPEPEPEPEFAPAAWSAAAPAASWTIMTPDDGVEVAAPYEAAGGAWPPATAYEADEYDDSAYIDDVPDDAPEGAPEGAPGGSPRFAPPPAAAAPTERPSPSPLVRELTLDMVEAEERRAALAERIASSRSPPSAPSAPAASPPSPASPPPAKSAAAPFRAPPAIRPLKRT
jgi:hypothetical protein